MGERETYWKQFVDPSMWSPTHPILNTANVRMVEVTDKTAVPLADGVNVNESEFADISTVVTPIDFQCLKPGLGLVLHHKNADPYGRPAGGFYCMRKCVRADK